MRRILFAVVALMTAWVPAHAAPCLLVTLTGTQGGPPAFKGLAGPGTLVRYGDDSDNCSAMKLQFDTGRGTVMRLAELDIAPEQLNAVFFTHMHTDHTEGYYGAATYVDKILHGAKPADLPIAGPTQFTMSANRTALKNLGLSLPSDVAARVDEWID